jgi:hypothetical protein
MLRCKGRLRAATIAAALLVTALIPTASAGAKAPAADCQPFASTPCLLPFPNDLFTRADHRTPTGLRVNLPAAAMPVNTAGKHIAVGEYDRADGFSPGSALIVHVSGLDLVKTGAVSLSNMSQAFVKRQPIVVIDERTGARQLIWAELDANAHGAQNINLLIHPGKNFTEGHTYIVALRNLRNGGGHLIKAPTWFARLRDGRALPKAERSQLVRYERIFNALKRAKIDRASLYEAWDFTVASQQSLSGRMLAIRDKAFAQLGDRKLADGVVQGAAPRFSVTGTDAPSSLHGVRRVVGTFTVPCYLAVCGPAATTGFHYSSHSPDALPTQIPGNNATAQFECMIPSTASPLHPARISLYGHGLLGKRGEVEAGNVLAMAAEHNFVFCATDWWGLAEPDTPFDASALADVNHFPVAVDRLQQGVLNTLFLGRLMLHSHGLAASAAFQSGGQPIIDTSHLYYDGNSQGGIMGGMTTAVAPDFRQAVLGVSGMNMGNVLVQRSHDFAPFATVLASNYPDASLTSVILDLMQQLWDRGDPDGYAQHMTSHPLPNTPSHNVLMQIAYGDHQVSDYAAMVQARTIGAAAHEPALDLNTDRARDRNMFYGIPSIAHYPSSGSAIVIWDGGPGQVQPPPFENVPPVKTATNTDPHEFVRSTVAARVQKSGFLAPNGKVFDVCAGKPCHTDSYVP